MGSAILLHYGIPLKKIIIIIIIIIITIIIIILILLLLRVDDQKERQPRSLFTHWDDTKL